MMTKTLLASLVLSLSAFCGTALAQEETSAPTAPESVVQREKPRATTNEIISWGSQQSSATWESGYAQGMTRAVAKTFEILYRFGYSPFRVCFPAGLSNAQLTDMIVADLQSQIVPSYGNGNVEDWDETMIVNIALATITRFRCN